MSFALYGQHEQITPRTNLLIIEDDLALQRVLRQMLELDHTLLFAQNPAEAQTVLQRQAVDLVLVDVTASQFDAAELLIELRSERSSAELPIILISPLDDSEAAVRGLQLGANDYITKPLDAEIVRARITTQIALRNAVSEPKRIITQLKFTQEMQENFSRIISHDLKGPLSNIRMAQFMLRDILRENNEASSILDNMDLTLNGMVEMIRTFLDAMESQQLDPYFEAINAHDLLVQTIEQYRLSAERKGITLRLCEPSSYMLTADQRLLRQVIGNLVSNAIKFSPPGTETCLWASRSENNIRINVQDGGPGISPDERGKLFIMFSKLSTRPTGGEASTGLGLWIVKELTRLQGGSAGVDHPAEGGALFWVELPAAPAGS